MSLKKSKAIPYKVIIREDRENTHHSLLIAAKDATVLAGSAFPVSMTDNILPFLPPHDLFILSQPSTFVKKICHMNWW